MERITNPLKNFLELPYDELEAINLKTAKDSQTKSEKELEEQHKEYLKKEKRIKAVTICFTDIEGRLHMLDYDKKYVLDSSDNLTFDGSSIRGFSALAESDLRLDIDWTSIRWLPSDVFGSGKIIIFSQVLTKDRKPYESDFRSQLKKLTADLKREKNITINVAHEIEGMLVDGLNAQQKYNQEDGFKLISTGGYYHSLPLDNLRQFIDQVAEAQRAMGFENEKDHAEVAPSQFELNYKYKEVIRASDQIQLYKLTCRQIANNLGMTASFLPKPIANINGNGMHTNISFNKKGKNIFYDKKGKENLSKEAWEVISRLLNHAPELSLIMNSSVNSYRRLDPNFEAPNQIKVSSMDRGSMIRIPMGNEKTARIEVRSVAPDANPYLLMYSLIKTALEGDKLVKNKDKRDRLRFLPGNINDAIKLFKASNFITEILGENSKNKYLEYKQSVADRSPRELGTFVKKSEVIYHHEVTNQMLWNQF